MNDLMSNMVLRDASASKKITAKIRIGKCEAIDDGGDLISRMRDEKCARGKGDGGDLMP